MALTFDRTFDPQHGHTVSLTPLVQRLTAANAGPFTFHGTNTYLIGHKEIAVIDPGPDHPAHLHQILDACSGSEIAGIFVSHTHVDHSPGAAYLQEKTGAPIYGCGPHRAARPLQLGEINPLDASCDLDYKPDTVMTNGMRVSGKDWTLEAIETPGHTANHLSFALHEEQTIFSADHIMAWSTSIVAPPDGSMPAFMRSLEAMLARPETRYWPGHGGPVDEAHAFVEGLITHRQQREKALVQALLQGPRTIPNMVKEIYADVDEALHGAAALSMLAQAEYLIEKGQITCEAELPDLTSLLSLA